METFDFNHPWVKHRNGGGEGNGGSGGKGGGPAPSVPDLMFAISPCINDQTIVDTIKSGIIGTQLVPQNSDVRTDCEIARDGEQTMKFAVWTTPAARDGSARDAGYKLLNIFRTNPNGSFIDKFAFFINSSFIVSLAQTAFNARFSASGFRADDNGSPNATGHLHLQGLNVDFVAPSTIVTSVVGFDDRPWPRAHFTLKMTDTLSSGGGSLNVASTSEVDTDLLGFIALGLVGLVLGGLSTLFFGLGALFFLEGGAIGVLSGNAAGSLNGTSGVGGILAVNLPRLVPIPLEPALPIPLSIHFRYLDVAVTTGGMIARGVTAISERNPQVHIHGPTSIFAEAGDPTATASYSVVWLDMRPDLSLTWTADGTSWNTSPPGTVNPTAPEIVDFDISKQKTEGHLAKVLSVRVVDADGVSAKASLSVAIHVVKRSNK